MALLKSITRYSQAPTAPVEIPSTALVLVEIDNQVFRTTYGDLAGAPTIDWTALPGYAAGEVQVLTNDEGTIGWVTAAD